MCKTPRYGIPCAMVATHGHFLAAEVGELAGVSGTTIGQWARWGYIRSSVSDGEPHVYSVEDVAEAAIVGELLGRGVSHADVRRAIARLGEEYGEWPLSEAPLGTADAARAHARRAARARRALRAVPARVAADDGAAADRRGAAAAQPAARRSGRSASGPRRARARSPRAASTTAGARPRAGPRGSTRWVSPATPIAPTAWPPWSKIGAATLDLAEHRLVALARETLLAHVVELGAQARRSERAVRQPRQRLGGELRDHVKRSGSAAAPPLPGLRQRIRVAGIALPRPLNRVTRPIESERSSRTSSTWPAIRVRLKRLRRFTLPRPCAPSATSSLEPAARALAAHLHRRAAPRPDDLQPRDRAAPGAAMKRARTGA